MTKRILKHNAVQELYKDGDGYWVVLKDGYEWFGCVSIHEYTLTRICNALKLINKIKSTCA
jgi:hypothetical protein